MATEPEPKRHDCDLVAVRGPRERHRAQFYGRCDCGWVSKIRPRKSEVFALIEAHQAPFR